MPYRRGSRPYRRRAPRRKTIWVRNVDAFATVGELGNAWLNMSDMLAPLHTSTNVELKLPGAGQSVSTVGATILRVHGKIQVTYAAEPQPTSQIFFGIQVENWSSDQENIGADQTGQDPTSADPYQGANMGDWMHWGVFYGGQLSSYTGALDIVGWTSFDVRAKRKLEDIGDTAVFCARTSGTDTPTEIRYATSTLLALP